ncbi:MAG: 23S rRNA (guanosine(2251)-2'-O)-methyltransferase RlmB [Nitrosospira sp.]|nr:23S rRNA (guanosine(2251)-2'-O)-methyltransferase RlmB [Nitrosospira sp.]MDW7642194.1 23S rRNA (guanosine(2251)-2'-O)-methyltransferase RlmB [Nitrosomonadaceae bacterium]MBI0407229.1 23S rRNA (guanosine(2251)-2'-O)-methyltransferase RlmB [Nitrosospira sp.]MBI0414833.1 23S rRNA (guanosine(2251)-2'-O)-methyltransferase RlmB [Nitrosospira sp.]MBI0415462.1 23S rRNA (guanosine(2251)-2'-O)-methyltransferase RlmB [Nitrosospira sp.]
MSNTHSIFGFHAITSRLRQNPDSVQEIFLDSTRRDQRVRDLTKLAETQGARIILCDEKRLVALSGSNFHQGVVANIDITRNHIDIEDVLETLTEPALLLVLDGVQDPHNLGACLRVADAFGAHAVIAPKDRAVGLNATVHKVASGAADVVPYIAVTNLTRTLRELKKQGIWIIGTSADAGTDLGSLKLDGPIAWVFGAEGEGMRRLTRDTCDQLISIPMLGSTESLNVSVSAGICLFETRRQERDKKIRID